MVIDCPPNITLLSENVFISSDLLLIPIIPSPLSERTFEQILDFYKKKNYPVKKVRAFFSLVEKRKKVHQETMERLMGKHSNIFSSQIPRSADVEKMGLHQKPIQLFARTRPSSIAFTELGNEILKIL